MRLLLRRRFVRGLHGENSAFRLFALCVAYIAIAMYDEIRLAHLNALKPCANDEPVKFNGHEFANMTTYRVFETETRRDKYHPWSKPIEEWLAYIILSACVGCLGGVVRFHIDPQAAIKPGLIVCVLTGTCIGPLILAAVFVSEEVILEGEPRFRPEATAAFCFLAGVFATQALTFVQEAAKKLFPKEEQPDV
jgi:hypothetical protein